MQEIRLMHVDDVSFNVTGIIYDKVNGSISVTSFMRESEPKEVKILAIKHIADKLIEEIEKSV